MRQSELFLKTQKKPPRDEEAANAQLLIRAGFIDKLMAGSYTLLPLGSRVLAKINDIIREELNKTGAQELLMPLLHPKSVWEDTGRWNTASGIMFQLEKDEKQFGLSFTHEEIVMDIMRKRNISYKDLPIKLYQFSAKFRNESRVRSGLLRGIEFLMNDLYSLHTNKESFEEYYGQIKEAYMKIFSRVGLKAKIVEAAGGIFTQEPTHEFQVLAPNGEDTIFYCDMCDWAQNKEIATLKEGDKCPDCGGNVQKARSIEVGNIFPLGTWYSEKMDIQYTTEDGSRKYPWFASYGIGTSRLIGTLAEVFNDKNGLMWPKSVAPFLVHLVRVENDKTVVREAENIYKELMKSFDVLYDDRQDVSAGEKFAEADLIGIPFRVVVSEKTIGQNKVEVKERSAKEVKLVSMAEAIKIIHVY